VPKGSDEMTALNVENIHKRYGHIQAVQDVSFSLKKGEIVGFLGPNGAGKSTSIKIICGYIWPDKGRVFINGIDVAQNRIEAQKQIGYLPESNPLYPELRVEEFLRYCSKIRGLGGAERSKAIDRVLETTGLTLRRTQPIQELSKGYKQRLGLAQTLVHDPPILILDEPTSGLDPNQIEEIRALISDLGQRKIILLSTHILSEFESTCSRVLIINNGTLIADGTVEDIVQRAQGGTLIRASFVSNKVEMKHQQIEAKLARLKEITKIKHFKNMHSSCDFSLLCTEDIRQKIFLFAQDEGLALVHLARDQSNLDNAFRTLTS
jgi:ABC-2 type transport system ATP-binding protein